MVFLYYGICFSKDPQPSLEGRTIKIEKENPILTIIEDRVGIPANFYRRLEFETGEEPHINVGLSTRIIPYYAKLKYLLDPENQSSPYYLFSLGINLVEGEDMAFDEFLDDIGQRVNFGIGVGILLKKLELEVLYGKYNYQNVGLSQEKEKSLYSSTKITFACKYRF